MTKKQFEGYIGKNIKCECCGKILQSSMFSYSYVRLDSTASRCKVCDWFKRNEIVKLENWTSEDIHILVEFVISGKSIILNDLLDTIKNKTIYDLIYAYQSLKIGNKKIRIKETCKTCGNDILYSPSAYLTLVSSNYYCSRECYWVDKPNTVGKGSNNSGYNRIHTKCTNCGKEIEVIPFDYNKTNGYGDNHNFCSHECYWEYRSKYYIGDKSISANRVFTEETLEKMRNTIIKNSRSAKRFDSKVQLIINSVLDKLNITYEREYIVGYYALDNYLTNTGLMIEVMGDYWHTSPLKYNESRYKINEMQAKGIHQDKSKHTYIKNHYDVEVLYLWEYDIEHNLDVCKNLILEYIEKNGILENYHSFNYCINNNKVLLNSNIIIPYQDMKIDEYRYLVKYKDIG